MTQRRRHFGRSQSAIEYILARFTITENGCWRWLAGSTRDGYPLCTPRLGAYRAHRLSYQTFVGPIPDGMELDHLCRERSCVNPAHLEPVTHRENTLRGGPGMMFRVEAARTHCPRGHEYNDKNTYVHRGKRSCRECKRLTELRRLERLRLAA